MTQEELDALMAGDLDDMEEPEQAKEEAKEEPNEINTNKTSIEIENYRISSGGEWPPPPPTKDHKMVHQLDDVTKDSEVKMTEIFDKLESVNNFLMESEEHANGVTELVAKQKELFTTLKEKFPNVKKFDEALQDCEAMQEKIDSLISDTQMGEDEIMMIMDIMQYQDIHRQKIERVINVMRALSKYMNSLFEGKIEDEKRVSSAVHIKGDETEDVVSNEDIEALISSLGKK